MKLKKEYNKIANSLGNHIENLKVSFKAEEDTLPYAYPCDNYIKKILSNQIVRSKLQKTVDKYYKSQIDDIITNGSEVTSITYPSLFEIFEYCCSKLQVSSHPKLYITNRLRGINALSVGSDETPIILLSYKCSMCLSEGELKFIIGHELGHILQKNLMCHTAKGLMDNLHKKSDVLGTIVADIIEVPLNQWCQSSEYTADRAGLICCEDLSCLDMLIKRFSNKSRLTKIEQDYFDLNMSHTNFDARSSKLKEFIGN